jgi:di/tricarboxylate transporter
MLVPPRISHAYIFFIVADLADSPTQSVLWTLPRRKRSRLLVFSQARLHILQLAIALAANIGGQSSPISSPQNLIALQAMQPPLDWGRWFLVAIPVSGVSIVLIWLLLLVSYRPSRLPTGDGTLEIKSIRPTRERFTVKQWWVTFVCVATISLWVVEQAIEKWIGDMGVIAIIPIVAFFGTGVLKKVGGHFLALLVVN